MTEISLILHSPSHWKAKSCTSFSHNDTWDFNMKPKRDAQKCSLAKIIKKCSLAKHICLFSVFQPFSFVPLFDLFDLNDDINPFQIDVLLFAGFTTVCRADEKTFDTPSPVKAEHSKYCFAPNFLAAALPFFAKTHFVGSLFWVIEMLCTWLLSSAVVSRWSVWVPTRIYGVFGRYCFSSWTHFDLTFSKESWSATEKQTTKTSVS